MKEKKRVGKTGSSKSKQPVKIPMGCVKTHKELAEVFGITSRSIRTWVKKGLPRTIKGFYDLVEVKSWLDDHGKCKKKTMEAIIQRQLAQMMTIVLFIGIFKVKKIMLYYKVKTEH